MHTYVCVYMYIHTAIHEYIHTYIIYAHTYMHTNYICIYARVLCMYVRTFAYVYYTHPYMHIYIYTYKYIYTYIHTYIYNTYVIAYYFHLLSYSSISVHFDNLHRPTLLEGWLNRRTATRYTWGGSLRQGSYFVEFRHLQFSWSGTTKYFCLSPTPQLISMFM